MMANMHLTVFCNACGTLLWAPDWCHDKKYCIAVSYADRVLGIKNVVL